MKSIEVGGPARPTPCDQVNDKVVVEHTRRWISAFVIGLGLCPFARQVFDAGRIRYAISHAHDKNTLTNDLHSELQLLLASPSTLIETTLLIHPHVLGDFLDYNDFLDVVDQLLEKLRLSSTIQVASFHPQYRFAGTESDAVENYTNRSPYPMLHLLREVSVTEVVDASAEVLTIPQRNIETMRDLGQEQILNRLRTLDVEP